MDEHGFAGVEGRGDAPQQRVQELYGHRRAAAPSSSDGDIHRSFRPVEIVTIDGRDIARSCGMQVDLPVFAKAAVEDGTLLGLWGLAWSEEPKRCWVFFHVENYRPDAGFIVRREGRRLLKRAAQLGEKYVYTPRDVQFPSSLKLMKLFGFEKFAVENKIEIWRCRVSN